MCVCVCVCVGDDKRIAIGHGGGDRMVGVQLASREKRRKMMRMRRTITNHTGVKERTI